MTLTVSGLSAQRSGRVILHPTSLTIASGERVGLVGRSGSGKSTLGHALIDALRAEGRPVAHVPQSPDEALDPLRTMAFHWDEANEALDHPVDAGRRDTLFASLGLNTKDIDKRPWGWSRGMQQRFVIALALMGTPDLLVMDEPTSALDPVVAANTMELLTAYLATRNTAVVLITHDMGLAAQHVERLLVMNDGSIVEDAATKTLLESATTA
ncbi:MAG: ATP-binding cassette domain-containing protein, partial [Pseudomonadota bacterium]